MIHIPELLIGITVGFWAAAILAFILAHGSKKQHRNIGPPVGFQPINHPMPHCKNPQPPKSE